MNGIGLIVHSLARNNRRRLASSSLSMTTTTAISAVAYQKVLLAIWSDDKAKSRMSKRCNYSSGSTFVE